MKKLSFALVFLLASCALRGQDDLAVRTLLPNGDPAIDGQRLNGTPTRIKGSSNNPGTIELIPGTGSSPRLVLIDGQTPNQTTELRLVAGDDVDDLVQIALLNDAANDGWRLLFDQGTVSDVFRIQDHLGNTAFVIDQTTLDTSFQTLVNVTNSVSLIAGDAVDDDARIRLQSSTGANGYQFFWDQSIDDLRIELHDGTDLMTLNAAGITMHVPCTGCGGGGLPVVDTTSIVEGSADATKEARIEVDTNVPTSTVVAGIWRASDFTFAATDLSNSFSQAQTFQTTIVAQSVIELTGTGTDYNIDRSSAEGLILGVLGGDDIMEIERVSSTLNEIRLQTGSGASDDVLLRFVNSTAANGFQWRWDRSVDAMIFELHDNTVLADWDANILVMSTDFATDASALAGLGSPIDGSLKYCTDCLKGSDPCTASSSGAFAARVNGAWQCM